MLLRTASAAVLACAIISVGAAVAAPGESPPAAQAPGRVRTPGDPFEPLNRKLFWVHKKLDKFIVRPIAITYKRVTPRPIRSGLSNALSNLGEPVTFLNDVLQLKPKRAGKTATRFVVNTTVGVGGLFDVASKLKIEHHDEDFGQTLGRYGAKPGPYIFVPVLGPSSVRDGLGRVVDAYSDPLNLNDLEVSRDARTGVTVLRGVDARASLDPTLQDVEQSATDEYATLRSAYWQNRAAEIADGETKVEDLPDFDDPSGPMPPPTPTDEPSPR